MLGFDFKEEDIYKYTDKELRNVIQVIQNELEERARTYRAKLIENFEKAFIELHENGIDIYFEDSDCVTDPIELDNLTYS